MSSDKVNIPQYQYTDIEGKKAFCKLEAHPNGVVIATELHSNTGASITNSVEIVANKVCADFKIPPARLLFIERYTDKDSYNRSGDLKIDVLVRFKVNQSGKLECVDWINIDDGYLLNVI